MPAQSRIECTAWAGSCTSEKGSRITAELEEQRMIRAYPAVVADLDRCEVRAAGLTVTSRTSDWQIGWHLGR